MSKTLHSRQRNVGKKNQISYQKTCKPTLNTLTSLPLGNEGEEKTVREKHKLKDIIIPIPPLKERNIKSEIFKLTQKGAKNKYKS